MRFILDWFWRHAAIGGWAAVLVIVGLTTACSGALSAPQSEDAWLPAPSPVPPRAPAPMHGVERAVVTEVVDGDTVEVSIYGDDNIRVLGIDAPETYGTEECWGAEATRAAERRLEGERVILRSDPQQGNTGAYGRRLRYIFLLDPPPVEGGRSLRQSVNYSIWAVANGNAYYAEEYPVEFTPELVVAEARARQADRGLWGVCY